MSDTKGKASREKGVTLTKFLWVDQVVCDPNLPPNAARVAQVIASYSNEAGNAFPGIDTLATILGVVRNCVKKSLKALEENGHLEIESGRGRRITSRYRMIRKADHVESSKRVKRVALFDEKRVTGVHEKGSFAFQKKGHARGHEHSYKNTPREHTEPSRLKEATKQDPRFASDRDREGFFRKKLFEAYRSRPGETIEEHNARIAEAQRQLELNSRPDPVEDVKF